MLSIPRSVLAASLLALFLLGCATQPRVRSLYDSDAEFERYRTYGFVERAGTDPGDYTSLLTRHLQVATARELEERGYHPSDDPDLLVNFFVRTREHLRITERPSMRFYYGYRRPYYGVWGAYPMDRDITQYRVGTLHLDIIDAERGQLVWEGIFDGRAAQQLLDDPRGAADRSVERIFEIFPYRAPPLEPEVTGNR